MNIVAFNIAFLRNKRGVSQQWLSDCLKVKRSTLGSWEQHRCEPPIEMLCQLSDFFEVSVDDLIRNDLRK